MKKQQISLGFSPCPNDTFMFHAMLHSLTDTGEFKFIPYIDDVEALNKLAFDEKLQITKLSFYAWLLLKDKYSLLDSGAALGFGCGPLLVAKTPPHDLTRAKIANPGIYTTAYMLLKLWNPNIGNAIPTRFDKILPGVASGKFDAGLIIHEGRFVYADYDLVKMVDLGEWWESQTRLPIPLGCIAIRNDPDTICHKEKIETILKDSVSYAFENRRASREFIKSYAQEIEDSVIDRHIHLYVNEFSLSLGGVGRQAVQMLEDMAQCRKIL
jgi:1,4-dihydroxy-6-naphthoate synthase